MIATSEKTTAPTVAKMTITPAMAAHWLENGNTRNRPISDAVVSRYARDMKAGRWQLSHQGLAFDAHGVLLDGQQRLWAVVEADVPVEMYVWFNLSADTLMIIDGGRSRSLVDHLRLGGGLGSVNKDQLSVMRYMLGHGLEVSMTADEAREQYRRHERAILFAVEHLPKIAYAHGIARADVRAVIARAWYSADHTNLADFCTILRKSIAQDEVDKVVVVLRDYLRGAVRSYRRDRRERYGKTERVLLAYLQDEPLSRICAATAELFPLPNESSSN